MENNDTLLVDPANPLHCPSKHAFVEAFLQREKETICQGIISSISKRLTSKKRFSQTKHRLLDCAAEIQTSSFVFVFWNARSWDHRRILQSLTATFTCTSSVSCFSDCYLLLGMSFPKSHTTSCFSKNKHELEVEVLLVNQTTLALRSKMGLQWLCIWKLLWRICGRSLPCQRKKGNSSMFSNALDNTHHSWHAVSNQNKETVATRNVHVFLSMTIENWKIKCNRRLAITIQVGLNHSIPPTLCKPATKLLSIALSTTVEFRTSGTILWTKLISRQHPHPSLTRTKNNWHSSHSIMTIKHIRKRKLQRRLQKSCFKKLPLAFLIVFKHCKFIISQSSSQSLRQEHFLSLSHLVIIPYRQVQVGFVYILPHFHVQNNFVTQPVVGICQD